MGTGHENPCLKIGDRDNFQNGSNSHLFQHGRVSMSAKFHAFITMCTVHFIIRCTISEKGCKSQGRTNEDSNSYIFEEDTRIYPKCNIFSCHTSQKFQNFHGKTLISRDPLPPSMAHFPKMGRFLTI